jgi:uncharacterized protein
LSSFSTNRLKRLTTYPKRFFADVTLALTLAALTSDDLRRQPTVAGHYLESYVLQQLRPQADRVGGLASHVRTSAGEREVDVIVEVGSQVVAFEVKHTTRPGPDDAASLAWLRDQLEDRFTAGFVVHTDRVLAAMKDPAEARSKQA